MRTQDSTKTLYYCVLRIEQFHSESEPLGPGLPGANEIARRCRAPRGDRGRRDRLSPRTKAVTAILAAYAIVDGRVYVGPGFFDRETGGRPRIEHIVRGILFVIAGTIAFSGLTATTAGLSAESRGSSAASAGSAQGCSRPGGQRA